MAVDKRLTRLDNTTIKVANNYNTDTTIFANESVPVESKAVDELSTFLELNDTITRYFANSPESFDTRPELSKVILTPDFHKAAGIPVGTVMATKGFVVPQAIGSDVNCGMRLHTTSLSVDQIKSNLNELETTFRHTFFEGGRNIPMTGKQRSALFIEGNSGLLRATPRTLTEGLWSLFHQANFEQSLDRVNHLGSFLPVKP